jgi:hypothetical protein
MSTTGLIVEMIVIGVFTLAWLLPLLSRLQPKLWDILSAALSGPGAIDGGVLTVIVLAITYQLGWLVDSVSRLIFFKLYDERQRRELFDASYERIRNSVFLGAPSEYVGELLAIRGVVRLSRSAVLNFLCLGAVLLVGSKATAAGLFVLFAAVASIWLWHNRVSKYYRRLREADAILSTPDVWSWRR